MKTGDVVHDGKNARYQVGLLMGRGLWGKTFRVRREGDHAEFCMKCPLGLDDLPAGLPKVDQIASGCRDIVKEQAEFLDKNSLPFLPRIESSFTTQAGERVLLLHRYPSTLEARLQSGSPFAEVVDVLFKVTQLLAQLKDITPSHGMLSPSNILLDERGGVFLSDFATPAVRRLLSRLIEASNDDFSYLPPEIVASRAESRLSFSGDAYALGMILWRISMGEEDYRPWPREGLDKAGLVTLKDRLHEKLKQEESNPRFHSRLTERLAAVVNRAISHQTDPSPPYRFQKQDEFSARIEELSSLVRPRVVSAGRLVFDRVPASSTFLTNETIRFSASVGCSPGVESPEEVACGIALFDRETSERIRNVDCGFDVDRHPSGRFRFAFTMQAPTPGSYKVRLAFAIRDSGQEPITKDGEFEIRAAPGYCSPRESPESQPLPLRRESEQLPDTQVGPAPVASESEPLPQPVLPRSTPLPQVTVKPLAPPPRANDPFGPAAPAPISLPPTPQPAPARPPQVQPAPLQPPRRTVPDEPLISAEPAPEPKPAPQPIRVQPGSQALRVEIQPARPQPKPAVQAPKAIQTPAVLVPDLPEPKPASAGYWTELPLPDSSEEDLWEERPESGAGRARLQLFWNRVVDLVRGDAYVLFMIGAGVLILILVIALFVLKG